MTHEELMERVREILDGIEHHGSGMAGKVWAFGRIMALVEPAMAEWISVDTRLPVNGQHILMACKGGSIVKGLRNENDWWGDNQNWRGGGQVTHWMPMPVHPAIIHGRLKV